MIRVLLHAARILGIICVIVAMPHDATALLAAVGVTIVLSTSSILGALSYGDGLKS